VGLRMLPESHRVPRLLGRSLAWSLLGLFVLSAGPVRAQLTGKDVNQAVDRAIRSLKNAQQANGSWPYTESYEPGLTALAVYALVHAGVPENDPSVEKAIRYVLQTPPSYTYSVALVAIALSEVNPTRYQATIRKCADWLSRNQGRDGTWTYNARRNFAGGGDNSNTQFAILGLHAARTAGAPIRSFVWDRIIDHFKSTQNRSGGWGYSGMSGVRVSMSAAGTASLIIAGDKLHSSTARCGSYKGNKNVLGGIQYLSQHWGEDAGHNAYYTMYALERVGILSGNKFIGRHEWYHELAGSLVRSQTAFGGWGAADRSGVVNTCFALLTLAKGKVPVLVNKLQWNGDWNNDRSDMKNLCTFISKQLENRAGWQVMSSKASIKDWMSAPLLYLNGHTAPKFTDAELEKLKEFLDRGSILFAEACCGRQEFDTGFRALLKKAFPERELDKLTSDHDVYRTYYTLNPKVTPLYGLNLGCRTGVIYSRRDISCDLEKVIHQNQAFKVGTNIALYAMGEDPLRDKLDELVLKPLKKQEAEASDELVQRGALTIGQVQHSGDWNTDTLAARNLQTHLRKEVNVTTTRDRFPIKLTSPDLPNFPVLFMTGHRRFKLSEEEREALRNHLLRGGFLFAEACCGRKAFDEAFRKEIKTVFPKKPLEKVPSSHPVFACGHRIEKVKYKPAVLKEKADFDEPYLEGIKHEGRTILMYSPYSIGCSLEGHSCPQCRGLEEDDAYKLAANIVIYALGF